METEIDEDVAWAENSPMPEPVQAAYDVFNNRVVPPASNKNFSEEIKRTMLKTCLLFLILFPLAANTVAASPVERAVSRQTLKSPEQVTRDFYKWYIHAINQNQDPIKQQQILSRYVTERLIREINREIRANEYDSDYFLCTQSFNNDWERNITVNAINSTPDRAAFNVTLKGAGIPNQLKVTLQKEAGVWKIDRVD